MTAQCGRATELQFCQRALYLRHGLRTMMFHKVRRVVPQQIEDSYRAFGLLLLLLLFGCSQPGNWSTGSQSMGLGADPRCSVLTCR